MSNKTIQAYTLLEVSRMFNKKSKLTIKAMAEKRCPEELQLIDGQYFLTSKGVELLSKAYKIKPVTASDSYAALNPMLNDIDNDVQELKKENAQLREQLDNANSNLSQAWQYVSEYKSLQAPKDKRIQELELTSYKYKVLAIVLLVLFVILLAVLMVFIFTR